MGYEFTMLCYIRLVSGLFALFLTVVLWRHRNTNGVIYLMLFEVAAAVWAICDGFESAAIGFEEKIRWARVSYIGISTNATMFLLFAICYADIQRFNNRRVFGILVVIPALTLIVALTDSYHHLIWSRIDFSENTHQVVYYYGPYFWVQAVYQYLILITGIIVLIIGALRVFSRHRAQFRIIILATLFPFLSSIVYVFKLLPIKGFDPTPISFILTGFLITLGIFWFRMFNIMPIARKQAIDNLRDGMMVVDSMGTIVDANPAFYDLTGHKTSQLIGQQAKDYLVAAGIDKEKFSAENDFTIETQILAGQEIVDFEVKYHSITDSNRQMLGGIYMLSNITTKKMILDAITDSNKRRKQELIEKEKLIMDLDAYARSVAHDLKNPLGSLVSLTDLIREKIEDNDLDEIDEMADIVCEQSRKMMRIIEGLLMLARIRKDDIVKVPVNTGEILDEVFRRLKNEIIKRDAVINLPAEWPVVLGHTQWIEEVWSNLISNALKYGGIPPVINMGYEQMSSTSVKFWIQDNGNGLPASSLKKIFEDFERLGVTDTDGYGLGLPIVKRIFEKLGGEITASSSNKPGEGCVFSFTLNKAVAGEPPGTDG